MANKQTRPTGKPVGILVEADAQAITEAVEKKLRDANETDRFRYDAALKQYALDNMAILSRQTCRLSFSKLPEYAACVDMTLKDAVASTGTALTWPSEELSELCSRLDRLSEKFILAVLDLVLRICPDFMNDKAIPDSIPHPRDRLQYVYDRIPMNANQRSNYARDSTTGNVYDSRLWLDSKAMSFAEIMAWIRKLKLSPGWVFGWMDMPVLAKTAKVERIMAIYPFLSQTLKRSFLLFLEQIEAAEHSGGSISIPTHQVAACGYPKPVITDVARFGVYQSCREDVLSKLNTPDNRVGYRGSDAAALVRPVVMHLRDEIMDHPQIAELTTERRASLLGIGADTMHCIKHKKRNFPMMAVIKACDDVFGFSVHQLVSSEIVTIRLPNWLGATAELLRPYSNDGAMDIADWIKQGMPDAAGYADRDLGTELFYPDYEPVGELFADRFVEIIEERYVNAKELFHGFRWKFLCERAYYQDDKYSERISPNVTSAQTILASITTGIPEDCLVKRDYLEYLPAVIAHGEDQCIPLTDSARTVLRSILRCVPEYRSKVLANIWASAYLGKRLPFIF